MRRGFFSRFVVCLVVFAAAFGVTFGALRAGGRKTAAQSASASAAPSVRPDGPEQSGQPDAAGTPGETAALPVETSAVFPDPETPPPGETGETDGQSTEGDFEFSAPSITPPYHEEKAPDDYFQDAVFVGNSLVEGLGLYAALYDASIDKAHFDTATSLTVFGAGDYFRDAADGGYGKVYIGLGLNEIGFDREAIREENEKAVDTIRAGNPDAIIYFFSLTPLSQHRSETDSLYNMKNAAEVSEIIRQVAEKKGCYYMDLNPVLAGSDGYLPSDVTGDGIHCVKEYYPKWYDYLEHNYVLP